MELLVRAVGNAAGLWLAAAVLSGLSIPGSPSLWTQLATLLVVGLVLALVNSLVKPVARFLAFPLYVLTFGLFALVVNGAMLLLASRLTRALGPVGSELGVPVGLHVDGLVTAIIGSVIISVISALVVAMVGPRQRD